MPPQKGWEILLRAHYSLHCNGPVIAAPNLIRGKQSPEIATLARRSASARRHVVPRSAGLLAMTPLGSFEANYFMLSLIIAERRFHKEQERDRSLSAIGREAVGKSTVSEREAQGKETQAGRYRAWVSSGEIKNLQRGNRQKRWVSGSDFLRTSF
jgi:hypothetical protein